MTICLVAAGIIWTVLRPDFPSMPTSEFKKVEETKYSPGNPACFPSRLDRLPDGEAADERYRCEVAADEHRLQNDDLVQQTRASNAAEAAVGLTYRQMLIELAGAIAGLITLLAAAYAAWYARKAADAGHQANVISESANRPWVVIDAQIINAHVKGTANAISITFEGIAQNIGKSAAENMTLASCLCFHSRELTEACDGARKRVKGEMEDERFNSVKRRLVPNETHSSFSQNNSSPLYFDKRHVRDKAKIFFFVIARYFCSSNDEPQTVEKLFVVHEGPAHEVFTLHGIRLPFKRTLSAEDLVLMETSEAREVWDAQET